MLRIIINNVSKTIILTFIVLLTFIFSSCNSKNSNGITIPVISYEGENSPPITENNHKDKDVELYNSKLGNSNVYFSIFYRLENNELKGYQAIVNSVNNYDEATFEWINDSTVSIKLYNANNSQKFVVSGYDNTTTLDW